MTTTLSSANNGDSVVGSFANVSMAAPPRRPSAIAAANASSSTMPPRPALIKRIPGLACASTALLTRPTVSGVLVAWMETKSQAATSSSIVGTSATPELAGAIRAHERVVRDQPHAERVRALGDENADAPEADDAERLAVQLDAFPLRAIPRAVLQVGVRLRHVARLRQQQCERVLGRGEDVRLRRVHDHDAAASGLGDVDVVEPDPRSSDHHEIGRGFEHRRRHLGCAADHQRVRALDRRQELLRREIGLDVDVETGGAHGLEPTLGQRFGDKYARQPSAARVDGYPSNSAIRRTPSPRSSSPSANDSRA